MSKRRDIYLWYQMAGEYRCPYCLKTTLSASKKEWIRCKWCKEEFNKDASDITEEGDYSLTTEERDS